MVRRKRKTNTDLFGKLRTKIAEAKITGSGLSKVALERGVVIGKQLSDKGTEMGKRIGEKSMDSFEKGIASAKNAALSKKEVLELIEKLGQLKADGLLTEEEFQSKKKELLAKI